MDSWENDAPIHDGAIERESLGVSKLHSKYMRIMTGEKTVINNLILDKDVLADKLMRYFLGEIDGKDIGRPPFQLKLTKSNAEKAMLADDEYLTIIKRIKLQEEKLLYLKEVVDQINKRSFHIKNYIEWKKWTNGDG